MELTLDYSHHVQNLKIKKENDKQYVFDPIRKKWLVLQPEEFVRQTFLQYLILEKKYNVNRISVEQEINVNGLSKRCDILIYNEVIKPFIIIECKSHSTPLTQKTFDQIARYNLSLRVEFIVLTNGAQTYCCKVDFEKESYVFIDRIPFN